MQLESILESLSAFNSGSLWIIQIFIVVFATLLLAFAQRILTNRLYQRFKQTQLLWDDALVDALRRPLHFLIWILGMSAAIYIVRKETEATIFDFMEPLRDVGVVSMIAWFLIRLVNNIQGNVVDQGETRGVPIDTTTADAIGKLLRASIIITSTLVALQTLGFSISGVLAFGGIGGIAVGFAAKDLLANFFGGLMIYLDRPFVKGDWVRSPDRDIEGTVEHIGWRLTCIRTFDKRPLYIPNATFASIAVENPSRMSHRRIYETIGIRYDDADKMGAIVDDVRAMLLAHEEIDTSQALIVNFNQFAASSLDFFIYAFTHTTNWIHYHTVKQDVLLKTYAIISQHGAEIAFPTQTLHMSSEQCVPAETEQGGIISEAVSSKGNMPS